MRTTYLFPCSALILLTAAALAQSGPAAPSGPALDLQPWHYQLSMQGGAGVGDRSAFHFLSAGFQIGKVLTDPGGPGLLRGQFEYAIEVDPYWQAFTPAPHLQTVHYKVNGVPMTAVVPYAGGTFSGASVTPIILRWHFRPRASTLTSASSSSRFVPSVQGAGGLIWTNHKFPPDAVVPHGYPGGASVFNFTPQFGIGFDYFLKPHRSISFAANAVHISSASLGDRNPGVNASVQFQLGYSWWK
ncbi:MAG TPA: acyloxyacyl hydrolase [Acidisarcina sp.]